MPLEPIADDFDVQVDWDEVPENDLVAEGLYEFVVTKAERGWTKTDKLGVEISLSVGAGPLEGARLRPETYTLGDEMDPKGELLETRKKVFGWMNLKRLCLATGVRFDQQLRSTIQQLEGARFTGQVKVITQADKNKDGSPNPYAGNQQNRITAYYPVGQGGMTPAPTGGSLAQSLHSGNGAGTTPGPQPQPRMSVAQAMAHAAREQEGHHPARDAHAEDDDLPF